MNLQNLGVQEMNAMELTTIDGGDSWLGDAWEILKEVDEGWDEFKDRLADGWNSYGDCSC